jgi:hypothetical protein
LPSLKFYLSPVKIASLIGMILRLSDDLDETLRLDHPDIVTFEEQQEKYGPALSPISCAQQTYLTPSAQTGHHRNQDKAAKESSGQAAKQDLRVAVHRTQGVADAA